MFRYIISIIIVSSFFVIFDIGNADAFFSKEDDQNISKEENSEDISTSPVLIEQKNNDEFQPLEKETILDKIIEVDIESKAKPENIESISNIKEDEKETITEDGIIKRREIALVPDFKNKELLNEINIKIDSIQQEIRYLMGLNIFFILISFLIFKKALTKKRTFY